MVWGLGKKKNASSDQTLDRQLKVEGGLTAIKGTEYTKMRIDGSDAGIEEIIKRKTKLYDQLLKNIKTKEDRQELAMLEKELQIWEYYKQYKRASAPWATAGEDHDMSHRLRQMEILFYRNLSEPEMWEPLMMCLQYITDICYKEWHIAPPPTIIFQTPVMPGYRPVVPEGSDHVRAD